MAALVHPEEGLPWSACSSSCRPCCSPSQRVHRACSTPLVAPPTRPRPGVRPPLRVPGGGGSSEDDSGWEGLAGLLLYPIVGGPFLVPRMILEGNSDRDAYFPAHPYALPNANYLSLDLATESVKNVGLGASVENGNNFSGLNRVGVRSWLDTTSRFGLVANFDLFTERKGCGCFGSAFLADLELTYRFAQNEWMQMHAGLGARGWFDHDRTRGGFNFLYSAEVFPVKPLVLSGAVELGTLHEAFTMRLRGSAGVQWNHLEVFAGYDWLRIGSADLHGPMAGLRLWF